MSDEEIQQINPGETSEAELIQLLGEPDAITFKSSTGTKILEYRSIEKSPHALSFVPLIGLVSMSVQGEGDIHTKHLMFYVQNGLIVDYKIQEATEQY